MLSLVENEPLRIRLIQAGKQRVAHFSDSKQMEKEYWGLFQEALALNQQKNWLF